MQLKGMDDLRDWLVSQGFKCAPNSLRSEGNLCDWYAYRRSAIPARVCEGNSDKPGAQIVIKPFEMQIGEIRHRSIEVEICGEANGTWWNLDAYGINPDELRDKLESVEKSLVAAWNALTGDAYKEEEDADRRAD